MSSRSIQIIGGPSREKAEVEDGQRALRVYLVNGGAGGGGGGGGGVTEYSEDSAHTSGDQGNMTLAVRNDAGTTLVDADGDYAPLQVDATGALRTTVTFPSSITIDDGGGSITVDGVVAVSGAVDVSGSTVTIQEPLSIDDGGGSVTVDGTVAVSAISGTVAVIQSGSWAVSLTGLPAENAVVGAGHDVFPAGVVRDDALTTLGVADGDWTNLRVSGRGAIWVEPATTWPVSINAQTIDVSIDDGGNSITVDGTVAVSSVGGTVAVTQSGAWTVTIQDGGNIISIDDGGGSITVDGTVAATLALPAENEVVVAGHDVFPMGVVRNNTLTTLGVADGDWTNLRTNNRGALWIASDGVIPVSDNGGSLTVDGTVSISGSVDVSGSTVTIQEPLSIDDGGGSITVDGTVAVSSVGGTVAVTQSGVWAVTIQEPLSIDDNGGSITVDGTVAATQSGAWTVTIQDGGNVISVDDGGSSLTVDGTVGISGTVDVSGSTVTIQEPLSIDDNGGSITVDQATRTNLLTNSSLQLQGVDVVAASTAAVTRSVRVPVSEYGSAGLPNFYANIASVYEIPATVIADPVLGTTVGVTSTGGLETAPSRQASINALISAQTYNNTTTSSNSSSVNTTNYREMVVYIDLASSGSPTNIRLIAQFSDDGGTTWFDYAVDQWVDLRYVPAQMPLTEAIPLNYGIGRLFRLRAVATGTTASNTFTLTATMEVLT